MKFSLAGGAALLCAWNFAYAQLPEHNPIPGGVAVIRLPAVAALQRVQFGARRVLVTAHQTNRYAVVGLPMDIAPGNYALHLTADTGREFSQRFSIAPAPPKPPRVFQLPRALANLSLVSRLPANRRGLNDELWKYAAPPNLNFTAPVAYEQFIPYGMLAHKRFGDRHLRHPWLTYFAAPGAGVRAPAAGVVHRLGRTRYSGVLVYLNHGQGVASVFSHLADTDLQPGEKVARGQRIGTVKSVLRDRSGRVDWQLLMNGNLIDPRPLVAR